MVIKAHQPLEVKTARQDTRRKAGGEGTAGGRASEEGFHGGEEVGGSLAESFCRAPFLQAKPVEKPAVKAPVG